MKFNIDSYIICGTLEECKTNENIKADSYIHILDINKVYVIKPDVSDIVTNSGLYLHPFKTNISDSVNTDITNTTVPADKYMVVSTVDFIKLMKRVDALELRCSNIETELGLIDLDLISIKDKLLALESGASSSGDKITKLEADLAFVNSETVRLQGNLTDHTVNNATDIALINSNISDLRAYDTANNTVVDSISNSITSINQSINIITADVSKNKSAITNINSNIDSSNTAISTIDLSLTNLTIDVRDIDTVVTANTNAIVDANISINNNSTAVATLTNTTNTNTLAISTNKASIEALDNRVKVLETPTAP